ncbi:MAG: Lacal_2735 family protein [Cyclobacteriaceae bacterium]|nr:Lacal_2735 family protein [Cyclobacteriaceae bacterium]
MFGIFKKETEVDKLTRQYKTLLEESYKLSHHNRAASDQKAVEAEELMVKIEALRLKTSGKMQ